MEEREKEDLYIPTYVTAQHEYFPGFGKKELYLTILMSAFVLLFIAYLKEQQVYLYKYKDEWKVEE